MSHNGTQPFCDIDAVIERKQQEEAMTPTENQNNAEPVTEGSVFPLEELREMVERSVAQAQSEVEFNDGRGYERGDDARRKKWKGRLARYRKVQAWLSTLPHSHVPPNPQKGQEGGKVCEGGGDLQNLKRYDIENVIDRDGHPSASIVPDPLGQYVLWSDVQRFLHPTPYTPEPPKEPGLYWWVMIGSQKPCMLEVYRKDSGRLFVSQLEVEKWGGLWSQRIVPPPVNAEISNA